MEEDVPVVMQLLDAGLGVPVYLRHYDPNAHEGRGAVSWTTDLALAKKFPSMMEGLEEWRRASDVRPLRSDGKPNRPLSAHTVSFERVWR